MSQESPRSLIIDLSNAHMPAALGGECVLHETQLNQLLDRVSEITSRVPSFKEQLHCPDSGKSKTISYARSHDVITVHGKRGTGKTTFLLSALNILNSKEQVEAQLKKDPPKKGLENLCVLEIMDPTLFGLHEHLLLTLLSKVVKKVRAHCRRSSVGLCDAKDASCAQENWEKSLRGLSKGLKYIGEARDDLDSGKANAIPQWEDAEFFMEEGMNNALCGVELERRFHMFLNESLKLLDKTAFVLALDDVDTRPNIGWHVLEVLRRYFTSPQLVVILSGDMDLFKKIIEKRQLEIFGLDFKTSPDVLRQFQPRVDDLTEQYLLKILRTPSRMSLGSFQMALRALRHGSGEAPHVFVKKNDGTEESLDVVLSRLYTLLGARGATERHLFEKALFTNSARTVVQVLDGLVHARGNEAKVDRLREVFMVSLQNLGFEQPQALAEALQDPQGVTLLMKKLFVRDAVAQGFELLPTHSEADVNNARLALQAELTKAMRTNAAVLFDYAFKACLLREVFELRSDDVTDKTYPNFESYLALESGELLSMTAARITALHWGDSAISGSLCRRGVIRLFASSIVKSKPGAALLALYGVEDGALVHTVPPQLQKFYDVARASGERLFNTPETLRDTLVCWQRDLAGLGIVEVHRGGASFSGFSIFPLLATMADMLGDGHGNTALLLEGYAQTASIKAFGLQRTALESRTEEKNETEDVAAELDEISEDEEKRRNSFLEKMEEWQVKNRSRKWHLPATLCARIMSRFFWALERIDKGLKSEDTFVGVYIHRCLVAFFNSVLVEEFLLSPQVSPQGENPRKVSLDNPTTTDKVFLNNIISTGAIKDCEKNLKKPHYILSQYPLFSAVFTFPLWGMYLDSTANAGVWNEYTRVQNIDIEREYANIFYGEELSKLPNLYPVLNSLAVSKSPRQVKKTTDVSTSDSTDLRATNRRRARLPDLPVRFPRTKIIADVLANTPGLVAAYKGMEGSVPDGFPRVFRDIVDNYYPETQSNKHLYTNAMCKSFWTDLKWYFQQ